MDSEISKLYEIYLKNPLISTDSRGVKPGSIFFALKGDNFNGNDFALNALNKGSVVAVVDEIKSTSSDRIIVVNDALKALQNLAMFHRSTLKTRIIGVTGTNGKTTTKELIYRVLQKKYNVAATQGNLNNHIGVPLTILSITPDTDFAVIEMGANKIGEIGALCEIAKPDYGIITNIGRAHLEGFGSFEGVIKGKTELYNYIRKTGGTLFTNISNELLIKAANGIQTVYYGNNKEAKCFGKINESFPFLTMDCNLDKGKISFQTQLIGAYNFENVMAAVCMGTFFNVPASDIKMAIESYAPSNNRSQIVRTAKNLLILDAYNANPSSMKEALDNFNVSRYENKAVILGDMLELGTATENEHKIIVNLVNAIGFDHVMLIGPNFQQANNYHNFLNFQTTDRFLEYLKKSPLENMTILIKGSRKMQLEKVVSVL